MANIFAKDKLNIMCKILKWLLTWKQTFANISL